VHLSVTQQVHDGPAHSQHPRREGPAVVGAAAESRRSGQRLLRQAAILNGCIREGQGWEAGTFELFQVIPTAGPIAGT